MAFQTVSGYGNLPNGNFSPVIYSKKAQIAFRKSSVVMAVCNTDYMGEISDYGDTVNIILEPDVTVSSYARGQQVTAQELDDEQIVLVIDKANSFAFKVDDIEKRHSHINFESLASNRAGYKLKDAMDSEIFTYISTEVPAAATEGDTTTPTKVGFGTPANFSPVALINRLARHLDINDVPETDRWMVVDPYFVERLRDENSKLLDQDFVQDSSQTLRNGLVTARPVYGFKLYMSRNLPVVGTGPSATTGSNGGWVFAGHMSSTSCAEQINKTENFRDPDSFADVVRGLHLYGRKVLRTESLAAAVWQSDA
jgi:hypothetical protein